MGKDFSTSILKALEVEKFILNLCSDKDSTGIKKEDIYSQYKGGQLIYAIEAYRLPFFVL